MRGRLLLIAAVAALAGCVAASAPAPVPARTAAELAGTLWLTAETEWRIRQSALLELGPARVAMSGFLLLRPGEARLVGLDDLGMKLFDLTVSADGHEEHFLLPDLARLPGMAETVAASVRRIFLTPRPAAGDRLRQTRDGIALERAGEGKTVRFLFGGPAADLVQTEVRGGGEEWRVRCHDYRPEGETRIPGRIVLEDRRGNYRLTLWLEEVRRS